VRNTRPDDIGVSFSYPLPGTIFYERVKAELGPKRNWTDSDDLCIMFRAAYSTDFYRAVRDALHAEVSSWTEKKPQSSAIAAMWRIVEEVEPMSRQDDALTLSESSSAHGLIMPLPALSSAGEI
jgi:anaerobic magnesium-protoporphyrin IX monomethyl ester cyclase